MAVGEIKNAFHATCVFEDEIFALFVPASTSAKGSASSGLQGRWLDDTATVAEAQLSNNQKLLLLKKPPPPSLALGGRSQSTMLPEASRHHRSKTATLSRLFRGSSSRDSDSSEKPKRSASVLVASSPVPMAAAAAAAAPNQMARPSPRSVAAQRHKQSGVSFDTENQQELAKIEKAQSSAQRRECITTFLSSFLDTRLTPDDLLARHIIMDKPVAEVPLNMAVLEQCCTWLRKHALDVEGIFRISGPTQSVQGLVECFVSGSFSLESNTSPHIVSSALKTYLRERVFPLIPYRCFRVALKRHLASGSRSRPYSAEECRAFFDLLPPEKQPALEYMLTFLCEVAEHQQHSKMSMQNLAIVFGPTLMRTHAEGMASLSESETQVELLSSLLSYHASCQK